MTIEECERQLNLTTSWKRKRDLEKCLKRLKMGKNKENHLEKGAK